MVNGNVNIDILSTFKLYYNIMIR